MHVILYSLIGHCIRRLTKACSETCCLLEGSINQLQYIAADPDDTLGETACYIQQVALHSSCRLSNTLSLSLSSVTLTASCFSAAK